MNYHDIIIIVTMIMNTALVMWELEASVIIEERNNQVASILNYRNQEEGSGLPQ